MHALRLCGTASALVRSPPRGPPPFSPSFLLFHQPPGARGPGLESRHTESRGRSGGSDGWEPGWSAYALGRGARGQASRPAANPYLLQVSKLQAGARPESVSTWCPGALFPRQPTSEPPEQRCERQETQGGEQPGEGCLWASRRATAGWRGAPTAIAPRVLTCTGAPGMDLRPCSTPAGPAPPRREPWCCPERREKEAS